MVLATWFQRLYGAIECADSEYDIFKNIIQWNLCNRGLWNRGTSVIGEPMERENIFPYK